MPGCYAPGGTDDRLVVSRRRGRRLTLSCTSARARSIALLVILAEGQERGSALHRREAQRGQPSRGERAQVGLARAHHRPAHRGGGRIASLVAGVRSRAQRQLADLSPKTVNNVLCVLNTMLKVAVEWGVLEEMSARVKLLKVSPSEVPFYEPHEYERLVEAARNIGDHRLLVFVLLGGDAGLRCGEIIALGQTDIGPQARRSARPAERVGRPLDPPQERARAEGRSHRAARGGAGQEPAPARAARALARRERRQGDSGAAREVDAAPAAPSGAQGNRSAAHPPPHRQFNAT